MQALPGNVRIPFTTFFTIESDETREEGRDGEREREKRVEMEEREMIGLKDNCKTCHHPFFLSTTSCFYACNHQWRSFLPFVFPSP